MTDLHARMPFRGPQLLSHPLYNKGSAFTPEEREAFGLDGLLPSAVNTLEQQARRVYENLARKTDPLERYIGLASLEDRNEHLFHHVLGEPFDAVSYGGRTIRLGQCNNAFIFPGMGLGALVAEAREVSDQMFRVAAECLAEQVSDVELAAGALYPRVRDLRRVSTRIAFAVAREARDSGVGRPLDDGALARAIADAQWEPRYVPLVQGEGSHG